MSELRDAIDKALPDIMAEHSGHLVTEGVVKVAIMPSASDAIMALIEQSRPSREEFERNVDLLLEQHESLICCYDRERPKQQRRVDERRREVMRMAGYPEER